MVNLKSVILILIASITIGFSEDCKDDNLRSIGENIAYELVRWVNSDVKNPSIVKIVCKSDYLRFCYIAVGITWKEETLWGFSEKENGMTVFIIADANYENPIAYFADVYTGTNLEMPSKIKTLPQKTAYLLGKNAGPDDKPMHYKRLSSPLKKIHLEGTYVSKGDEISYTFSGNQVTRRLSFIGESGTFVIRGKFAYLKLKGYDEDIVLEVLSPYIVKETLPFFGEINSFNREKLRRLID